MTTRSKYNAQTLEFFDEPSFETVGPMAPLQFLEDFIGAGHSAGIPAAGAPVAGYPWVKKIVGTGLPTAALVANGAGGQVALTLQATNEIEEASIYWNDGLVLDVTKKLVLEARVALSVAPSAAGVQAVFGLAQAWAATPDTNARYLEFGATANNGLLVRSKDGVTTVSQAAALIATPTVPITLDANFHVFKIDASDPADIAFWYDGYRVNAKGSITWQATSANSLMQPYLSVYKTASTGLATLTIDKVDLWSNRV